MRCWRSLPGTSPGPASISSNGSRDVLKLLLAGVGKIDFELIPHLIMDAGADAYSSRLRKSLQSRRNIYSVPVDVVSINNNVTNVDPNAKLKPSLLVSSSILLCHLALNFNRTAHSIHRACELHEQSISHRLDDASAMLSDLGINQNAPQLL